MKFPAPVTIEWMANFISASTQGESDQLITGINEIHVVEPGDMVFVDHPKYYEKCLNSAAEFIIINSKDVVVPAGKMIFVVEDPFEAYLSIVDHFKPFTVQHTAVSQDLQLGEGTILMPQVYIGKGVTIGKDCIIHPQVTILDGTQIGDRVVIQSGTVVGSDAFYYNTKKNRPVWYKKMKSCGSVEIGNDVEIGAACTIDRGVTGITRIGEGTKLDNMVHIGHDTQVGKNCLFAAQVGIAGGTIIEDGVILWQVEKLTWVTPLKKQELKEENLSG